MAPVAGVPKRVPCHQCGNPVFLAERLTIGKLLYHRTCLRCARCKSQLTPGSFYETEIDGVFCCETCPDEENLLANKLRNGMDEVDNVAAADVQRQSFREKIAIFQTDGRGLLQKSLSDEEKSKSLKRINDFLTKKENERNEATAAATASSSLVYDDESESEEESSNNSDVIKSAGGNGGYRAWSPKNDDSDDSDDNDDVTVPPPLPNSPPPPDIDATDEKINLISVLDSQLAPTDNNVTMPSIESQLPMDKTSLTIKLNLDNTENMKILDKNLIIDTPATTCETSHTLNTNQQQIIKTTSTTTITDATENDNTVTVCEQKMNNLKETNNMPSDALNNFNNVTKEHDNNNRTNNIQQKQEKTGDDIENGIDSKAQVILLSGATAANGTEVVDIRDAADTEKSNIYRTSSVVRNRLSQFEALLENEQKRASNWTSKPGHSRTSSNDSRKLRTTKSIDANNPMLNDMNAFKSLSNPNVQENNTDNSITNNLNMNVPSADQLNVKSNENSDLPHIKATDSKNSNNNFDKVNNLSYHKIIKPTAMIENMNVDAITEDTTNNGDNISINTNVKEANAINAENRPVPLKRNIVNELTDENMVKATKIGSLPPTPSKRKNKLLINNENDGAIEESLFELTNEQISEITDRPQQKPIPRIELQTETIDEQNGATATTTDENVKYPVNLNPFGSDDEDGDDAQVKIRSKSNNIQKVDTSNPFDSSDDEIELLKETTPRKIASQNQRQTVQFR